MTETPALVAPPVEPTPTTSFYFSAKCAAQLPPHRSLSTVLGKPFTELRPIGTAPSKDFPDLVKVCDATLADVVTIHR